MKSIRYLGSTGLAICLFAAVAQAMNSAAVDEILKLKTAGLGEDSIIAFIERQNVDYRLTADDIILLNNQGLSSAVLTAMLNSGRPTSPPATMNVPVAAVPAPSKVPAVPTVAAPPAIAPAMDQDAAYFFQELNPHGRWIVAEDNQWYWQPAVAVTSRTWRPYWDRGHWIHSDSGWYWASDYPWGWAAFHYGRWRLHPLHGWMWLPDRVWAPAWVTWRTGGDYCGWAPLPPGSYFDNGGRLVFRGKHVVVDFDFGLDWHHFNFCLVREMGGQHRGHFHRDDDRRRMFHQTTIRNHFTVQKIVVENQINSTSLTRWRCDAGAGLES